MPCQNSDYIFQQSSCISLSLSSVDVYVLEGALAALFHYNSLLGNVLQDFCKLFFNCQCSIWNLFLVPKGRSEVRICQNKKFSLLSLFDNKLDQTNWPVFRSLRICADLQDFSAGFCKDRCTESWRSIQICKIFTEVCRFSLQIFAEICFSAPSREPITAFLDFFNYFINYFTWPRLSQLILSITQNSREEKFVPITVVMVTVECAVLLIHRNLSISLELSGSGCWTLRSSFALLTSFCRIKFDMQQPSGLVDVLIKCCCCNISGTRFVGVILIISGKSEYVIVIYWSLFGSVKICKILQICTDCCRKMFHHFDINEISLGF